MMKNRSILTIAILQLIIASSTYAQTLKSKDVIISSLIPDNFSGRYNVGLEYVLPRKKDNLISISLNGTKTSISVLNQNIEGFDFTGEIKLYGEILMKKKWNEYGGLKISAGSFTNNTLLEKKDFYFIGIGTGIQPIIAKVFAVKISADLGYTRNVLSNTLLFNNNSTPFHSGFVILFNVGIGVKL